MIITTKNINPDRYVLLVDGAPACDAEGNVRSYVNAIAAAKHARVLGLTSARAVTAGDAERARVAAKRKGGPSLTDARRAELGWARLTLRLPAAVVDALGVLAHERGVSRAELVAELVERAHETKVKL